MVPCLCNFSPTEAHGVNRVNYPFPEGLAFEDKWPIAHISLPLLTLFPILTLLYYDAMNEVKTLRLFPLAISNHRFTLVNWRRR